MNPWKEVDQTRVSTTKKCKTCAAAGEDLLQEFSTRFPVSMKCNGQKEFCPHSCQKKKKSSVLVKWCFGTFLHLSTQQLMHQVHEDFFSFHVVFTNLLFGSICNALMQTSPNVYIFQESTERRREAVTVVAVCFAGIHGDILDKWWVSTQATPTS